MTETPEPQPSIWIGALEFTPGIATQIGLYLAQITAFELALNKYFGILAGVSYEGVPQAVFGRIINVSARIDILKALAKLPPNSRWQPVLSELIAQAKSINTKRNEYVHGTYTVNRNTKKVTLITWVLSEDRPSKSYNITAQSIDADTMSVRHFLFRTMSLFHPDLKFPSSDLPSIELPSWPERSPAKPPPD